MIFGGIDGGINTSTLYGEFCVQPGNSVISDKPY
jgi:hypothetical protein